MFNQKDIKMKKLVLVFALAGTLLVGSTACSKKGDASSEASVLATKIENCTNTDSLQLYVAQAKAYAEKLVREGKAEQAKEYLAKIEPVVKEKSPAAAQALSAAGNLIDKAVDSVKKGTDNAADAVKDAADATADKANEAADAVSDKANEVKDAAADKANEVKDAATEKAAEVKDAAADKANQAADAVKDKLNELKSK